MRVIGGEYKGLKLDSIDEKGLRPMLDRVKESLFNILQGEMGGAVVLDLFSGSGALGIEAISRGARSCTFVEQNRRLTHLILQNLKTCGIAEEKTQVISGSVYALSGRCPPAETSAADLVFVDPPYAVISDVRSRVELINLLAELVPAWVSTAVTLVLHHEPMPHVLWPEDVFCCYDRRVYGRSQLSFFRPVGA